MSDNYPKDIARPLKITVKNGDITDPVIIDLLVALESAIHSFGHHELHPDQDCKYCRILVRESA
jgi:hypothetical protein